LLYSPNEVYGVCFSPNSQLLYGLKIIGGNLYQWDLQAGTTANIIASRIDVAIVPGSGAPYRGGAIQQGPDGKLYITQYNQPFLSVINNPDVLGVGCGFQPNAVSLSNRNSVLGLPPFVINFLSAPAEITHSLPCLGMPVQFNLDIYTADAITWNFGDPASGVNNVSNELNPTHIYNSTGTYAVMAIRQQSCVQDTFFVDVTIEPLNQIVHHDTICAGDTYVLPGGQIIANPGMYLDTLTNGSSCGEIHVYNLAWMVNDTIDVYVTVCDGEGYTLETGQTVYNSGTYNTYQNCQLKRVHITVLPAQSTTSEYTLCHNEVFTLPNGTSVSTGGTYTTPFQGQNGCDSLVVVVLNYLPQSLISNSITICEGDNYTGPNGALLNQPGLYTDTLQTLFGCDSIIHTNLFVSVSQVELNVEICSNRSYQRPSGGSVNQSGQYVDILMSSAGCDSTIVTNLSVNPAHHNVQRLEYCRDEIMHRPNGQLIIDSGIYYDTLYTSLGCDSTFITEVVIHELPSDEFYWQPTVVKESDDFVMLIASDLGSSQNDWYINDLWVSSQQEFQYALKDLSDDEIEVCMLSTSNEGCISWSCKTIPVLPILRVYCPNAFTPNGDEQNEVFKPVVTGEDAQFYHFMIFNRWGEMIFETNNPDEGWLGNTNGGEYYVPNGVYAWVLEVKELATAEYYSFRGHVVLFR
jgi:gliding motility-associated-like protein